MNLLVKKTLNIISAISIFSAISICSQFSFGQDGSAVKQLDPALTVQPESPYSFLMTNIYMEAQSELSSIENDMYDSRYSSAKFKAANLFDKIELQAKFVNVIPSIPIENGILTDADLFTAYKDLDNNKKDKIALLLQSYQSGAFMNMLNLAKRVKLLWIKASLNQLNLERHSLYKRDVQQFLKAAIEIHNIAIKIQSPDMKYGYLLFDSEFANSVRDSDFNREIMTFVLDDNKKIFNLTEEAFEDQLEQNIANRRSEYVSGFKTLVNPVRSSAQNKNSSLIRNRAELTIACMRKLYPSSPFNNGEALEYSEKSSSYELCEQMQDCLVNAYRTLNKDNSIRICMAQYPPK